MPLRRDPGGTGVAVLVPGIGDVAADLPARLVAFCKLHALDIPISEYPVVPGRKWRFDYAWPKEKVAVELDGGTWARGRHTRGMGFERDCWKLDIAVADGWRVLRFTPRMVERQWEACSEVLRMTFRITAQQPAQSRPAARGRR